MPLMHTDIQSLIIANERKLLWINGGIDGGNAGGNDDVDGDVHGNTGGDIDIVTAHQFNQLPRFMWRLGSPNEVRKCCTGYLGS